MRIKIAAVEPGKVRFETAYGIAEAIWCGAAAVINHEYFVEVDIENTLVWGENVVAAVSCPSINSVGEKVHIVGLLESVEDDGYCVMRVGESVVPFVAMGTPPAIESPVEVLAECIFLTPYEY